MATNYIQPGDVLTLPAPRANVQPNEIIAIGAIVGIALTGFDVAAGDLIDVGTRGVYLVGKVAADAMALGDTVYVSASGLATKTTGTPKLGTVVEAAPAATGTVKVRIAAF